MNARERTEAIERETLSPCAALSAESKGRALPEEKCPLRTDFARDRDRIIHCKAFRRLKQKTQVFLAPMGDHYRTRLTHTLEVSQIARTVSRALGLNEDLTEAVALGHDLGHTPFGHAGERALDDLCSFGFAHYEQSVRVVERLERSQRGLNLTWETLDGMKNHTKGDWAVTIEGRVVRWADRIAYLNHDLEDAISARALEESDLPERVRRVLGERKSQRITTLVNELVESFDGELHIGGEIGEAYKEFYDFMFSSVYLNFSKAAKLEEAKVFGLVEQLYKRYMERPFEMPDFYKSIAEAEGVERAVADYISGMTDAYAVHCFEELFVPKSWELR
ncbi:MAG: deoxyguanosinetriphosphate triphosphohydrolase [Oscillospiraceae bacterium]|nr:deoxyguanosinetriphosphate triphosphohydrolase [Oscillospiraceae bacterium]